MLAQHRLLANVVDPELATTVAFSLEGGALTWGALDARSNALASAMRGAGIGRGERVACLLETSLDLVVTLVAHHKLGVVHVPINTRYAHAEIAHIVQDSGARWLFASESLLTPLGGPEERFDADGLERVIVLGSDEWRALSGGSAEAPIEHPPSFVDAACADEDTAMLIYTSGTTGRSKGVMLPFRAIAGGIGGLVGLWQWVREDVLVLALPLFHVHGLCIGVHGTLLTGNRSVLLPRFDAEAVCTAMANGGTVFMGVPTMHARLVQHLDANPEAARSFANARLVTSGSAALSADLFARFEAHTGHRILERYGMSETLLTLSNPYDGVRRAGTVGRPVPGYDAQLVDEQGGPVEPGGIGEIEVRGAGLMTGYWGLPEQTQASFRDGWFRTGDVAIQSDDGVFRIIGRSSVDIIKSGGFKISAREIEEAIEVDTDVAELAVIGIPDEVWGQRIVAAVVPTSSGDNEQAEWLERLQARSRERLADFKCIRDVRVIAELPRNALGKVQKHKLAGLFE
ncbi:MAG: acyl-CoA synthetase (AMP-forming)/AMP-acid ligase II [Bradymonadia bacterium]